MPRDNVARAHVLGRCFAMSFLHMVFGCLFNETRSRTPYPTTGSKLLKAPG